MDKKFLKSKPVCKTTFILPSEVAGEAQKAIILGDFNNWDVKEGVVMKKLANGSFKATVDLDAEKRYEFKYFLDDSTWVNAPDADGTAANRFGGENSVVDTRSN